jgi:hypothetical protein
MTDRLLCIPVARRDQLPTQGWIPVNRERILLPNHRYKEALQRYAEWKKVFARLRFSNSHYLYRLSPYSVHPLKLKVCGIEFGGSCSIQISHRFAPLAAPLPPSRAGRASMPPLARPPVPTIPTNGDGPVKGLGIKPRSMSTHQDLEQQDISVILPTRKPSSPADDGVSDKIRQLIEDAVSGIRVEFQEALEKERLEVLRLRAELEDLRKRLDV